MLCTIRKTASRVKMTTAALP